MRKKIIAVFLILVNVLSLASCTASNNSGADEKERDEDKHSYTEEKIYYSIDKIVSALALCDGEELSKRCAVSPDSIINNMPVVEEDDDDDDLYAKPDNILLIRNMIASTFTYEIEESTYKASVLDKKYSVDVTFSCKDYNKVALQRDKFLGAADFNMLMEEEERTIDRTFKLEFVKKDKQYLLSNPDDLAGIYDFDLPELEFMDDLFDTIENSYMTGPGWDPYTECYYDTNTFEFVIDLDYHAQNYVWQYIYRVSEETEPEWTHIYTSDTIVDRYPEQIHLTYTQEENFHTGFYCFIIYDYQSSRIYGWEFSVYNSNDTINTKTT